MRRYFCILLVCWGAVAGAMDVPFPQEDRQFIPKLGADTLLSPELYLSLGNAAFTAGRPGRAVLAYERGLRLRPGHKALRNNLRYVREEAGITAPPPPDNWLLRVWRSLGAVVGSRTSLYIGIILWWLGVAGLTFWLLRRREMDEKRRFILLPTALGLLALAGLCYALSKSRLAYLARQDEVVLTAPAGATLRVSPGPEGSVEDELREGARLTVTDRVGDYLKVRTEGGRQGYVRAGVVEVI